MTQKHFMSNTLLGAVAAVVMGICTTVATADEPCGDLEECRVFIEINASDGDIGFHVLLDAEGWEQVRIIDADGKIIFREQANGALKDQKLTENFFESAEPLCAFDEDDPEAEVVPLSEFLERFPEGTYEFRNKLEGGEELAGTTIFTHNIPAAPADVDFDGSVISWEYGDDLGEECTDGFVVALEVDIVGYEVVLEPDDPDHPELSSFKFTVQVPSDVNSVTVSAEYLASLPDDTPLKVEVGAIERRLFGPTLSDESFGNTTFTEEDGFCNNKNQNKCDSED